MIFFFKALLFCQETVFLSYGTVKKHVLKCLNDKTPASYEEQKRSF